MKFTHDGTEYDVAELERWILLHANDSAHVPKLSDKYAAVAALLAMHERVCEALEECRSVLALVGDGANAHTAKATRAFDIATLALHRAALRGEEAPR